MKKKLKIKEELKNVMKILKKMTKNQMIMKIKNMKKFCKMKQKNVLQNEDWKTNANEEIKKRKI